MATLRPSIAVSILFTVFGAPGIVVVYLPLSIAHFRIAADEPLWHWLLAVPVILAGLTPWVEAVAGSQR